MEVNHDPDVTVSKVIVNRKRELVQRFEEVTTTNSRTGESTTVRKPIEPESELRDRPEISDEEVERINAENAKRDEDERVSLADANA